VVIHYSVGIRQDALFTGTGSAVKGLLTVDAPAPVNVGIGDEVRAGAERYFISRRNSATSFNIQTGHTNGHAPGIDTASFTSQNISLFRAFNSLEGAVNALSPSNASDSLHISTKDLVAGNYLLSISCYADGEDTKAARVQGWRTSPINCIRIFTPEIDSEAGANQRHQGKWTPSAYALHVIADASYQAALECDVGHLKIDGLQVWIVSNNRVVDGIQFYEQGNGEFDVSRCLIRGAISGAQANGRGIYVYNNSGSGPFIRFWNNIIYGLADDSISAAIQLQSSNISGALANNTLVNCHFGVIGNVDNVILRNNLIQGCEQGFLIWGQYNPQNDYNVSDKVEWDLTAIHSKDTAIVDFVDRMNEDFHLSPTDTVARDHGFSSPVPGLFGDDIDGQTRITPWDVGADEEQ